MEENKATCLDGVSAKLLQLSAPVLSKTITRLLNLSIATGTFPSKSRPSTSLVKGLNKITLGLFQYYVILVNSWKNIFMNHSICI